jgi:hypothetical protein
MDRPEEGRIHDLAKRAAPGAIESLNEHLAKPKSRIVAIERHNCDWRDGRKHDRDRFLWIKAKHVSQQCHTFTETACCPTPVSFVYALAADTRIRNTLSPTSKTAIATTTGTWLDNLN